MSIGLSHGIFCKNHVLGGKNAHRSYRNAALCWKIAFFGEGLYQDARLYPLYLALFGLSRSDFDSLNVRLSNEYWVVFDWASKVGKKGLF